MLESKKHSTIRRFSNEEIMLRSGLIYLSRAAWAQRLVTRWKFARRAAERFVAGDTIQDAIRVVKQLNSAGIHATLDHLGEQTAAIPEAVKAADDILDLLDQINASRIRANVSVKLSQIGLALDENTCSENLARILTRARQYGNFVRIDMEDTPFTDKTIDMYRRMRKMGFDNTGLAIQAYLYRSEKDTRELLDEGAFIRLVKGAYDEPPEVAFPKKNDVDANFDHLTKLMIDAAFVSGSPEAGSDGHFPPRPAIASHDPRRIQFAKNMAVKIGLPRSGLEFQMLYGIRRDLQEQCAKEGYPVRVYVPYGTHWYPYFVRRMAERPANLWFFLSNFFRK